MQLKSRQETSTTAQTIRLGAEIGNRVRIGTTVALRGSLGAGKTTLVKGIARSLQIREPVTSPTFTLISEYRGRREGRPVTLYHIDLYRIVHPQEIEDLGLEEILSAGSLSVIEWAEKAAGLLPEGTVYVDISITGNGKRDISISGLTL
jgi:tRNA threonylcarbamoyladenosine biosynthesis protein TsaE